MVSKELIHHLETNLSQKIISIKPLAGGDINEVYALGTETQNLVIKVNSSSRYPGMFEAEASGLIELKSSKAFVIPEVIAYGDVKDISFLVIDYIASGDKKNNFWIEFGQQLATLHQHSKGAFGFKEDNYIGSLPQYNKIHYTASEFYITQRLEPQFSMAGERGFSFSDLSGFYKNIESEIPDEPSSLIHGDLWGGNYLINENGSPCLIDPAVAYASREMDIAMMHLFGGFDPELFQVYNDMFPLQKGWKNRIPLFQLYYLLVHLNLFGSSYYSRVKSGMESYL